MSERTADARRTTQPAATGGAAARKHNFQSIQFGWFLGHVLTVLGTTFYALSYVGIGRKLATAWYFLALIGIVESFAILVFQTVTKRGANIAVLIKEDNVHYLLIALVMLIVRPYVLLPLLPFAVYSIFHVLVYINNYLLPQENPAITSFVKSNNIKSVEIGVVLELLSWVWFLVRLITFRQRSVIPFIAYTIFIKIKYEKMILTRNYVKDVEIRIDNIVNQANVPAVKQAWISFKQIIGKVGSIYLVNDYTKEKTT
ncbi:pore membrane protein of 33 kDa [Diutina catenulata]